MSTEIIDEKKVNGNDSQIKDNGGEKTTDDLSDIKLIEKLEYEKLSEKDKKEYVKYNPSLTSEAYYQWLNAQNMMAEQFNQLGPMISKMSPLAGGTLDLTAPPLGLQQMLDAIKAPLDAADKVGATLKSITAPLSKVGLDAITEIFTVAFQLIGALAGMVYATIMNPLNMIDAYYTALKQIDIDAIKNTLDTEITPNLEVQNIKMEELVIPDKEIKQLVMDNVTATKAAYEQAKAIINSAELIKDTIETAKRIDDDYKKVMETFATMGLNWLPIGTEEMIEKMKIDFVKFSEIEKGNPYSQNALKMTNNVNDFVNKIPQKYIKVSDLEKLKEATKENKTEKA